MSQEPAIKLEKATRWSGRYRDVGFQISLHGVGESWNNEGKGTWCFYVYIAEEKATNFPALWLEDKVYRYKPEAKGRITHDYLSAFYGIEFHGGCTYYKKHGHTDGFRCVELGCDYAHLWDREHHQQGGEYTVHYVLGDVQNCINSLYECGVLKPKDEQ